MKVIEKKYDLSYTNYGIIEVYNMILRKPYAFFIKHFKLFNIILTMLEVYMIYKLSFLVQFLFEYSDYPQGAVGQDLVNNLLTLRVFIIDAIVILFSFILLTVLSFKKKPIKLYLFIILFNIILLITLFIIRNYLEIMQMQVIENRTAFVLRDLSLIGMILTIVITFITSMRALGFDIKKFEFGQDLSGLDISNEDNEEFEVKLDVDSQGLKRNVNRITRYFKYYIKEHKVSIIILLTIIIGLGSFLIYSRSGIYFNTIEINHAVKLDEFSVSVDAVYITDKDYKGNTVTSSDKTLVVVPIKIKSNSVKQAFNVARFVLKINSFEFYHTNIYRNKLIDLGVTYNDTVISTDFENYILVFEIPKNFANKSMLLQYNAENDAKVKFKVENYNLDNDKTTTNYELNTIAQFNNKILKEGTLIISEFDVNDKFQLSYNYCIDDNECMSSFEYIIPNYKNNYDKTILKLVGKINVTNYNNNLFNFINDYGTIIYSIDGKMKTHNVILSRVLPQKTKTTNTYYIEVLDEIKYAEHITIQFKLRNNIYNYKLK